MSIVGVNQKKRLMAGMAALLTNAREEICETCVSRVSALLADACRLSALPEGLEGIALELSVSLYRYYAGQLESGLYEAVKEGESQWNYACPLPADVLDLDRYSRELARWRSMKAPEGRMP